MNSSSGRINSAAIKKHIAPTIVHKLTITSFFGRPIAGRTYADTDEVYQKPLIPLASYFSLYDCQSILLALSVLLLSCFSFLCFYESAVGFLNCFSEVFFSIYGNFMSFSIVLNNSYYNILRIRKI